MQKKNQANILAKECIVTALMQLLEEKPFSAITISELTERAGVSRMTYYRNYQAKEDIFEIYLDDVLEHYREDVQELMLKGNYYDKDNMVHYFSYLKDHRIFLECLVKNGFGHLLLRTISKYVMATWYREGDGVERYYMLQAFAGALFTLYLTWSNNGMQETPEQMAEILRKIYNA